MRVRVTLMTENDVPVSVLGENPEQKIRDVWDACDYMETKTIIRLGKQYALEYMTKEGQTE